MRFTSIRTLFFRDDVKIFRSQGPGTTYVLLFVDTLSVAHMFLSIFNRICKYCLRGTPIEDGLHMEQGALWNMCVYVCIHFVITRVTVHQENIP